MQDSPLAVLQSMLLVPPEDLRSPPARPLADNHAATDGCTGVASPAEARASSRASAQGGASEQSAAQLGMMEARRAETDAWNSAVHAVTQDAAVSKELQAIAEFGVSCHLLAVVCAKACTAAGLGALL